MDIENLDAYLPHRPPILLLDRVIKIKPGASGTGIKKFVEGDPWFEGHFPGNPMLPGVYLIEAMAQTCLVILNADSEDSPAVGYLAKVNNTSFYEPVLPGHEIEIRMVITRKVGRFIMVEGEIYHGESRCVRADLTLAI